MRKQPVVGTNTGAFEGALDGLLARLIRRSTLGYTVELFASKGAFHQGDRVELSVSEFAINPRTMHHVAPGV